MDEHLLAIKKQIREWIRLDYIMPEDIPDIELYMDQVTTFMDQHLQHNRRNNEDKTLTKTMINNYTKNKLLPPPEKKRYSKEHIIILIYIYYLKNVISISDIQNLLNPMIERYFDAEDSNSGKTLYEIYNLIFELEKTQYFNIESSVAKAASITEKKFPTSDDEYLHKMAFIYLLSYDIYSKKRLIEKMIDELAEEETAKKKEEKQESSKKETVKKESAKKENAKKEAEKKQPSKKEAAKKEPVKKEPEKPSAKK